MLLLKVRKFKYPGPKFNFTGEILSLCDSFSFGKREFYFDRSPRIFENILGLYRKGELHLTERVCPRDFMGELEYWGLSALHLGKKCMHIILARGVTLNCRALLCLHSSEIILAAPNSGPWGGSR